MNSTTRKIIKEIETDLLILAKLILDDDSISDNIKVRKNTLKDSRLQKDIKVDSKTQGNVVIQAFFDYYVTYIEWDRPPKYGKQPPLDSLIDWARKKGIPTDNSTLFLIARSIWEIGHKGRPILKTLSNEIKKDFDKENYAKLYESITTDIVEFFNN